jgi:hypothetical protein
VLAAARAAEAVRAADEPQQQAAVAVVADKAAVRAGLQQRNSSK